MYWRVFLGNLRHLVPVVLMALALGFGSILMFWASVIIHESRSHFLRTIGFVPHIRVHFNEAIDDKEKASISSFSINMTGIARFNFGYMMEKDFEIDWYDEIEKKWHMSIKREIVLIGLSIPRPKQKKIVLWKEDKDSGESVNVIYTSFRPNSIQVEMPKELFNRISDGRWWFNPREILPSQGYLRFWEKGVRLPYFSQKSEGRPIKKDRISLFLPLDTEEMEEAERKKIEGLATNLTIRLLASRFASDVVTVLNQKAREKLDYLVYGPVYYSIDSQYPVFFMSNCLFDDVFHDKFAFRKVRLNSHNLTMRGKCIAFFDYYPSKNFNQNLILFNVRDLWKQMNIPEGHYNLLEIKLTDINHLNMVEKRLTAFLDKKRFDPAQYDILSWHDIVGSRLTIPDHIAATGKALLVFICMMILVVLISLILYYYKLITFEYELLRSWGMKRWAPFFIIFLPVSAIGWLIFTIIGFISINSLNRILEVNYYPTIEWPANIYLSSLIVLILISAISTFIASMIHRLRMRSKKVDF